MTTRWIAIALTSGLIFGCGTDRDAIHSGSYLCQSSDDCTWGWTCDEAQGVCVNTADKSDAGPGGRQDKGVQPEIDQGVPSVCTANTKLCVDLGSYKTCNSAGTGYGAAIACPDFQRCENGACVNAARVVGGLYIGYAVNMPPSAGETTSFNASFTYNTPGNTGGATPPAEDTCRHEVSDSGGSSGAVAFDAGPITVSGAGFTTRTLTYDATKKGYVESPALGTSDYPWGKTLTFSGQGGGLVHGAFTGTLTAPPEQRITAPASFFYYSKGKDLLVKWSGATGKGTVRFDVSADPTYSSGYITCRARDDGEFTIPASLFSAFPQQTTMSLALINEPSTSFTAKGLNSGMAGGFLVFQQRGYVQ